MTENGPYHPTQDIDPRLQDPIDADVHAFSSAPPPLLQQQQYTAPPAWPPPGYNPYYGHPGQQTSQAVQSPHQAPLPYQQYDPSSIPIQPENNESKRSRACEICRGLKVRCEPDLSGGPCKRCAKTGRNCVISPPSRKRQKKTDSRVAELERKIDALTQSLKSTKENISDDGNAGEHGGSQGLADPVNDIHYQNTLGNGNSYGNSRKRPISEFEQDGFSGSLPAGAPFSADPANPPNIALSTDNGDSANKTLDPTPGVSHGQPLQASSWKRGMTSDAVDDRDADVVGRGLLSTSKADKLFAYFTKHMSPHMPVVAFPAGTPADAVRKTSPILFLAILSVASIQDDSNLRVQLTKEIMRILGDRIFASPEKSLELVQALQVATIWYWPEAMCDSKYLQFVHFATAMAMALGINEEQEVKRPQAFDLAPSFSIANTASTECRRAWLGCYLLSSNISMGRRRPNLIRVDEYLLDCLRVLREADDALDSDRTLCDLVQLQTYADDLAAQILPSGSTIIPEPRVRGAHKVFERQMKDWQESKGQASGSLSLTQAYNVITLYMHELEMQHVANAEPAKQSVRARANNSSQLSSTTSASSSTNVLTSILGILGAFAKFDQQETRSLPVFLFAQLGHAAISLIKLFYVAKSDPDFGQQYPVTSSMVESELGRLIEILNSTSNGATPLAAASFLQMMVRLKDLFVEHKDNTVEEVRAKYGAIPSMRQIQILDLEEPQPTPQQRSAAQQVGKTAHGALQLLSEVAMGKSSAEKYRTDEGYTKALPVARPTSEDGGVAAMGQMIGAGSMGSLSDEGIFGIMQTMWTKRVS